MTTLKSPGLKSTLAYLFNCQPKCKSSSKNIDIHFGTADHCCGEIHVTGDKEVEARG